MLSFQPAASINKHLYGSEHECGITFVSRNPKVIKMPHRSRHIVSTKKGDFDPRKVLATVGEGKRVLSFTKRQTVFTQGDAADAVFYIQEGKIRLTVAVTASATSLIHRA